MLRRFIESGPTPDLLDDAYLLMAAAMFGMKEQTETIRYVNQLLGEFPSSDLVDRAKLLLAKTHARAGNLDLALPLLSEVRSLSTDPAVKRDALRLTGEFQAQKKDFLRAIQAWLDELPLDTGEQAHDTESQIRGVGHREARYPNACTRTDAYPKRFRRPRVYQADRTPHRIGEDHLVEAGSAPVSQPVPHACVRRESRRSAGCGPDQIQIASLLHCRYFSHVRQTGPFGTEVLNGIQLALERPKDGGDSPSIGLIVKDTESDRAAFLDELSMCSPTIDRWP